MNSAARVAIVGVGQVGSSAAYAMILASVARELLLIDINLDRRDSQVRDLADAAYAANSNTRVRAATHREASQCDLIVITAGSKITKGETSLEYIYRNISMVRNAVGSMTPFREDVIILVVSNPVDLLTTIVLDLSKLPPSQVLGSGTFLDSVRLRGLLADKAGLAAPSIDLYVLGVHGEGQVAAWSTATIGGVSIDVALPPETRINRTSLVEDGKQRAADVMQAKGSTPFGIGAIISSISSSILLDKRNVRPISHFQPDFGCCFSLPAVLGRKGAVATIKTPLESWEEEALTKSVKALKAVIDRWNE